MTDEPKSPRRIHFISCFGALTLHYCTFFSLLYFTCINIPPWTKSVRIETQNRTDQVLSFSPRRSFIGDTTCSETRVDLYRPHQVTVRQGWPGSSGGSAVLLPFVGGGAQGRTPSPETPLFCHCYPKAKRSIILFAFYYRY